MASLTLQGFKAPLLEPIDLQVAAGECISLSGPSGSGKTRLLRAIADLDPHQGNALLGASPQSNMSGPAWRRQVGLLPAESFWWSNQVGEHFTDLHDPVFATLGFTPESHAWDISRLSSGERQRLALARLLLNQPQALLLDEPTANLDKDNIQRVEELLKQWRSEHACAVIWISHDQEQRSRVASRHFQIAAGRLQEVQWN